MKIENRKKLGDVLKEYKEKNTDNKYKPVAVGRYGIRKREEIYSKELAKDYSKNKLIYKNTLTVGMGSKQIDIGILTEDAIYAVSPAYHTFRINNIDANYLRYCLDARNADMSERFMIASARQGKSVDFKKMLEYEIPVYSESDTQTILFNLSKIEEVILNLDGQLEKMDLLVKSRFVELFGDEKSFRVNAQNSVKDVGDVGVGIVIQPTQYYAETGVKAFRSLNVKPFRVNNTDWVYFSEDTNRMMERTQVHTNNIAVVRSGANLGDACVITDEYNGCNAIDILIIRINENIVLPEYLCAFINLPHGREQILRLQRGGALKHINVKELENSHLLVPPMDLQKRFADFINYTDKSKLAVQEMKNKMEILKASVMQEYFC